MIAKIQLEEGERSYEFNTVGSSGSVNRREFRQDKLVQVKLYGQLARVAGRELFELAVTSFQEVLNALHHLSRQATTQYFSETHKTVRWKVVINGHEIKDNPHIIDELTIEQNLETVEISPVIQGAAGMGWLQALLGVLMIIVGVILSVTGVGAAFGAPLIVGGIAALIGGIIQLFDSPSSQSPMSAKKQKAAVNTPSYLFGGSVNVQDQGGPVPLAYGKVICGSQLIGASITSSAVSFIGPPNLVGGHADDTIPLPLASSDLLPIEVTPRMRAYMRRTGMTVWPPDVDVITPQVGAAPDAPQYAVKHLDGSMGLIYGSDPYGPEENRVFPQKINESIIVTVAPPDTETSYKNLNI